MLTTFKLYQFQSTTVHNTTNTKQVVSRYADAALKTSGLKSIIYGNTTTAQNDKVV